MDRVIVVRNALTFASIPHNLCVDLHLDSWISAHLYVLERADSFPRAGGHVRHAWSWRCEGIDSSSEYDYD